MGEEIFIIPAIFLGLPWIIFHYITKWKTAATLTTDETKAHSLTTESVALDGARLKLDKEAPETVPGLPCESSTRKVNEAD